MLRDRIVGCVVTQAETVSRVHILALGVLVLYREKGVASRLLEESLRNVEEAYLHVQTDNATGKLSDCLTQMILSSDWLTAVQFYQIGRAHV